MSPSGAAAAVGKAIHAAIELRAELEAALLEVRPARGRRDEAMARRFEPYGVGCAAHARARTLGPSLRSARQPRARRRRVRQ